MYDPSVGRWLEEDPIGFAAGDADLYRYVGNDPVTRVDPSGTEWENPQCEQQLAKRIALFREAGKKNKIPKEIIDKILSTSIDTWIQPFQWDRCLAYVNEFQKNLGKKFGNTPFWPLKGTGLTGSVVSWDLDWIFSFWTNSHAAYEIKFPDGQIFYFDNNGIVGGRCGIALPGDLPTHFKNKK